VWELYIIKAVFHVLLLESFYSCCLLNVKQWQCLRASNEMYFEKEKADTERSRHTVLKISQSNTLVSINDRRIMLDPFLDCDQTNVKLFDQLFLSFVQIK